MVYNSMRLQEQKCREGIAAETSCANEGKSPRLDIQHKAHLPDTVKTKFPVGSSCKSYSHGTSGSQHNNHKHRSRMSSGEKTLQEGVEKKVCW